MRKITTRCKNSAGDRTRPSPVCFFKLITCLIALPALAGADVQDKGKDHWATLRLLEGSWRGDVSGRLGQGTGVRQYNFIFDDLYLLARHSSIRLPQEQSPQGDHHRELAIFSYDRSRETIVLREFNDEGYVLQYRCAVGTQGFVCDSETIESGDGMRARLSIELKDRYRFVETFELGAPGEEPGYYLTVRWTREPDPGD